MKDKSEQEIEKIKYSGKLLPQIKSLQETCRSSPGLPEWNGELKQKKKTEVK
jgi:hypothetical protein